MLESCSLQKQHPCVLDGGFEKRKSLGTANSYGTHGPAEVTLLPATAIPV